MKIPTIFGLALIITSFSLGLILYSYQKSINERLRTSSAPKKIEVINLTDSSATIVWQTDIAAAGGIIFRSGSDLINRSDDRDSSDKPNPHFIHIVTLKNLLPETKYLYQIKSGKFIYPQTSLEFQTPAKITETLKDSINPGFLQGTVLNSNLNPIDEALIFLKIEGASLVGGVTGTGGNFILPLNTIRSSNFKDFVKLNRLTSTVLMIERPGTVSKIEFNFPLVKYRLPPIAIGQNLNLEAFLASQSAVTTNSALKPDNSSYDQNSDGAINSLDLAIISKNASRRVFDRKSDLTLDGKVDQKDVDLLRKSL